MLVVAAALFLDDQPAALSQPAHFLQAHAGADARTGLAPEVAVAFVEQHDALLRVEQHEGIGDAFDGIQQVLMGGLGAQPRIAEQLVAGLQLDHRLAQRIGALAHLLGQHHRMLESAVGVVAAGIGGFNALDQRRIDPPQLVVVALQLVDARQQLSVRRCPGDGQWRRQ
ncbi:hypothetical protein D3C76_669680 [compost metagenome]